MFIRYFSFIFFIRTLSITCIKSQSTEDCGIVYTCFNYPADCQNTQCDFIFKWKPITDGNKTTDYQEFIISAKMIEPINIRSAWLAIGFSKDKFMGDDNVCLCKSMTNSENSIEMYYNKGKTEPVVLNQKRPGLGLKNRKIQVIGDFLICSFERKKSSSLENGYFNLRNKKFHVLAAYGELTSSGTIEQHVLQASSENSIDFDQQIKESKLELSNNRMIKAHACLMTIAWVFLVVIGSTLPRYFKFIFPKSLINGLHVWFFLHRPVMLLAFALTISSIIVIFVDKDWTWINPISLDAFVHSIFGMILIGLAFMQIFIAMLRPHQEKPYRYIFNYIHSGIGLATLITSIITIYIGVALDRMRLEYKGVGLVTGWLLWLLIFVPLIEFVETLFKKSNTFNYAMTDQEVRSNRLEFIKESERKQVQLERVKIGLGILHLMSCLAFTVGLLYVIIEA